LDNNTPNQVGENQTSPTILNYHLNSLPGLNNEPFNIEVKKEWFWDIWEDTVNNFESEPE